MSNTTEVFTGSSGSPEETPALFPAPGADTAGAAGTSPDRAGPVRSWPDGQAGAGETASAGTGRRGGTGLTAMLLPELQRLAQSMGISGVGRMRKGQLIEAIQERQGGQAAGRGEADGGRPASAGTAGSAGGAGRIARDKQGQAKENPVQRGVPAEPALRTPWSRTV